MDLTQDTKLRERLALRFDEVFESTERGYRYQRTEPVRLLLISWTPRA